MKTRPDLVKNPQIPLATSGLAWDEIRYVYDPLGRRLAKTVTENGAFKRATRFIYDGWNVVEERTERQGAPGISKFLFWGEDLSGSMQGAGGVGGLLTQMEKTDTSNWSASYYHYDGNGNVATVSGPFRAIIAKFSYDGFGRTVTQTGAKSGIDINAIPYRFSTKPMELELATANTTLVPPPVSSGLYYYGYRFYSPNLGRWISRDPIREKGGRNLYNFVGNDGVDKWDKLGLLYTEIYTAWGASAGAGVAVIGSIVLDAATGGLNVLATPAEIALGTAIGGLLGNVIGEVADNFSDNPPNRRPYPIDFPAEIDISFPEKPTRRQKRCAPCDPSVGIVGYEIAAPGSREKGAHKKGGGKDCGHVKLRIVYQTPLVLKTSGEPCKCGWQFLGAIENSQTPPAGSVEWASNNPVKGGGVVFY